MTTANRHTNAPYQDGETLEAADLELDIASVYAVVNGNIDNSNIVATANIVGSKLADNTIANAKLTTNTVTLTKMNAAAVPKAYVSTASSAANFGAGTTWGDVNSITAATLTAGQAGDFIEAECQIVTDQTAQSTANDISLGFEVASGTAAATATAVAERSFNPLTNENLKTTTWFFSFTATAAEDITIVPQVMGTVVGTGATIAYSTDSLRVFRARIIPIKS